jgi:hypothetical protein
MTAEKKLLLEYIAKGGTVTKIEQGSAKGCGYLSNWSRTRRALTILAK